LTVIEKCREDHVPAFEMVLEVPREFQPWMGKTATRLVCVNCKNELPWYAKYALHERSLA